MARILMMMAISFCCLGLARSAEMGAGAGTGYPSILDTDDTQETVDDYAREDIPNDLGAAIVAVENELGTNPSGASATVKDMINTLYRSTGGWISGQAYFNSYATFYSSVSFNQRVVFSSPTIFASSASFTYGNADPTPALGINTNSYFPLWIQGSGASGSGLTVSVPSQNYGIQVVAGGHGIEAQGTAAGFYDFKSKGTGTNQSLFYKVYADSIAPAGLNQVRISSGVEIDGDLVIRSTAPFPITPVANLVLDYYTGGGIYHPFWYVSLTGIEGSTSQLTESTSGGEKIQTVAGDIEIEAGGDDVLIDSDRTTFVGNITASSQTINGDSLLLGRVMANNSITGSSLTLSGDASIIGGGMRTLYTYSYNGLQLGASDSAHPTIFTPNYSAGWSDDGYTLKISSPISIGNNTPSDSSHLGKSPHLVVAGNILMAREGGDRGFTLYVGTISWVNGSYSTYTPTASNEITRTSLTITGDSLMLGRVMSNSSITASSMTITTGGLRLPDDTVLLSTNGLGGAPITDYAVYHPTAPFTNITASSITVNGDSLMLGRIMCNNSITGSSMAITGNVSIGTQINGDAAALTVMNGQTLVKGSNPQLQLLSNAVYVNSPNIVGISTMSYPGGVPISSFSITAINGAWGAANAYAARSYWSMSGYESLLVNACSHMVFRGGSVNNTLDQNCYPLQIIGRNVRVNMPLGYSTAEEDGINHARLSVFGDIYTSSGVIIKGGAYRVSNSVWGLECLDRVYIGSQTVVNANISASSLTINGDHLALGRIMSNNSITGSTATFSYYGIISGSSITVGGDSLLLGRVMSNNSITGSSLTASGDAVVHGSATVCGTLALGNNCNLTQANRLSVSALVGQRIANFQQSGDSQQLQILNSPSLGLFGSHDSIPRLGYVAFGANAIERMRITSNTVGIGFTASNGDMFQVAGGITGSTLTVNGLAWIKTGISVGATAGTSMGSGDITGVGKLSWSTDANTPPRLYSSSGLTIQCDANGTLFKDASTNLLMKVAAGGNVGIGNLDTPGDKLQVAGGITGTTLTVNGDSLMKGRVMSNNSITGTSITLTGTLYNTINIPIFPLVGNMSPSHDKPVSAGIIQETHFPDDANRDLFFDFTLPSDYVEGTDISPFILWYTSGTDAGNYVWEITFSSANPSSSPTARSAESTLTSTAAALGTAYGVAITSYTMSGTGMKVLASYTMQLMRRALAPADTNPASAWVRGLGIKYRVDGVGK